ncbi:MAG: hypothetical protein FWG57_08080 [Endomicrobia bacterium]|nr:hypothetical protein [Endomicrobiia bacterium]
MGMQEMSKKEEPCLCGKGTYSIKFLMDDYSKIKEEWIMNCEGCKNKYELETQYECDKFDKYEKYSWKIKI